MIRKLWTRADQSLREEILAAPAILIPALCTWSALAMHIAEGYLPAVWCMVWAVLSLPFVVLGLRKISVTTKDNNRLKMLLALAAAFSFVLSAIKFPSVTGSCSHMTGTGLGAILFGPTTMAVLGLIVLIFQALLLSHGGLTTLGANTFSMAIAGPYLTFILWKLLGATKLNKKAVVAISAGAGCLLTYVVTSAQLAFAHPGAAGIGASFAEFAGIFAFTQIPLAVAEGLLTMLVYYFLTVYCGDELTQLKTIDTKQEVAI